MNTTDSLKALPTAMELYARFDEQAESKPWRRLARIEKDSWRSIAWIVGTMMAEDRAAREPQRIGHEH